MSMDSVFNSPWTRKHNDPRTAHTPEAPTIGYPKSLPELIELCRHHPPGQRLKAVGSHWALSEAAVSDDTFIETNDPRNVHVAMAQALSNVVPKCLNSDYLRHKHAVEKRDRRPAYLFHVEAGKRIYQLYAEMGQLTDVADDKTLAGVMRRRFDTTRYAGSWAFPRLGGAGGQTVVGALSTGTHGGDWDRPSLADAVVALRLVADGGKRYWIEPVDGNEPPLTEDSRMSQEFRPAGFDQRTQSRLFAKAGTTHPYSPDPDHPGQAKPPSLLECACIRRRPDRLRDDAGVPRQGIRGVRVLVPLGAVPGAARHAEVRPHPFSGGCLSARRQGQSGTGRPRRHPGSKPEHERHPALGPTKRLRAARSGTHFR
ncbi:hypothetical protein [Streptomyces sirii]|uniref:hypothetical protein n=1 Tax=Streptomyces sirii TaxID=3127701 RepID=UPI003D35AF8D